MADITGTDNLENKALSVESMDNSTTDFDTTSSVGGGIAINDSKISEDTIPVLSEQEIASDEVMTQTEQPTLTATTEPMNPFAVQENADKLMQNKPPEPVNTTKKFDWFKNELSGYTDNLADLFQDGATPDKFDIKPVDEYWSDDAIKAPFIEKYGEDVGKQKFEEVYNISKNRLTGYKNADFDISATTERRYLPTQSNLWYEQLGLIKTFTNTSFRTDKDIPPEITAEGRKVKYGIVGKPLHSVRAAADDNGVMTDDGLISLDEYLDKYDAPLVYAVDNKGQYKYENGKAYLRPLGDHEVKKTYEEYYNRFSDASGLNDLSADGSYLYKLKFIPQNLGNFTNSVLDIGTEMYKSAEELAVGAANLFGADIKYYSKLYENAVSLENEMGKYLHVSSTDATARKWYTTEGLVSGLTQAVGQIGLAFATGRVSASTYARITGKSITNEATRKVANRTARIMMASIAAPGLKEQAKAAGLSDMETATMHALSFMGYYYITNLTTLMFEENPLVAKVIMKRALTKGLNKAGAIKSATGKLGYNTQIALSKNIAKNVNSMYNAVKAGTLKLPEMANFAKNKIVRSTGAGLIEAGEETTEALMEHSMMWSYDNIYKPVAQELGIVTDKDPNYDARFNTTWSQLGTDIAAGATIGFGAGAMSKRFFLRGNPMEKQNNYYTYAAENKIPEVRKMLEGLRYKGGLDNKYIDAEGNEITNSNIQKSRNEIAYEAIKRDLDTAEAVWESHGLNDAFATNEEKLGFLTSVNLHETSINKDLATALTTIDNLTEQNIELRSDTESDNAETIANNEKEIAKQKTILSDIKTGKRASKYYHEVMYNIKGNPLAFANYYELNSKHKSAITSHATKVAKANATITVDEVTDDSIISPEAGDVLLEQARIQHPDVIGDFGFPEMSSEFIAVSNKIRKGIAAYETLQSQNPNDVLFSGFDPYTFETGTSFVQSIENFEKDLERANTVGDIIFDNVEALNELGSQIRSRLFQLDGIVDSNELANEGLTKLGETANEPTFDEETVTNIKAQLNGMLSTVAVLHEEAMKNRENFEKSLIKANNIYINNHVNRQEEAADILSKLPSVDEKLINRIRDRIVDITATDDYVLREKLLIENDIDIHNTFINDKQTILDELYIYYDIISDEQNDMQRGVRINRELGIVSEVSQTIKFKDGIRREPNHSYPSPLRYLKSVITNDPSEFYAQYKNVLASIPETENDTVQFTKSRHILSPSQRQIVFQTAAFLQDDTKQPNVGLDSSFPSGINLTEGIFLSSYQGTGKTLVATWATKIDQMNRGGKVLVLANDKINRDNMAETMQGLDVKMASNSGVTVNNLIAHLATDAQKDINTIVIDEATLNDAAHLMKLDTTLRKINAKRRGPKIKVIYTGDSMQIGFVSTTGAQMNISSSGSLISHSTDEMKFSFRSGNDQVNNLLEFMRKKFDISKAIDRFTGKYDKEKLLGTEIHEGTDFDDAVSRVLKTLNTNDDFVIITEESKVADYKTKYNLRDEQVLTPFQAQGKQWKKVIIDVNTDIDTAFIKTGDIETKKKMLSTIGRAKEYILMRINNDMQEGITRGLYSVEGNPINVDTAITEDIRLNFLSREKQLMDSLEIPVTTDNTNLGTENETVDIPTVTEIEVIESMESKPLSQEERGMLHNIMSKIEASFNSKYAKVPAKDRFFITFSYFTNGMTFNEDGSITSVTNKDELLDVKRKIMYPRDGDDITNISFDLEIHDGRRDSLIQTQSDTWGKSATIKPEDKRIVIYATAETNGKKYKVALAVFLHPEHLGLKQSDLFDVSVPFTQAQSDHFLKTLQTGNSEESPDNPAVVQREIKLRRFDKKMGETSLKDFIETNKNFWYFAPTLWIRTKNEKEQQAYLLYSPTKTPQEIQDMVLANPDIIDGKNEGSADIYKIEVDGANNVPTDEGFDLINRYYTKSGDVSYTQLPKISDKSNNELQTWLIEKSGIKAEAAGKQKSIHRIYQSVTKAYYNAVHKTANANKDTAATARKRVLFTALSFGYYNVKSTKSGNTIIQGSNQFVDNIVEYREEQGIEKIVTKKNGKSVTQYVTKTKNGKEFKTSEVPYFKEKQYKFGARRAIGQLYKTIATSTNDMEVKAAKDILNEIQNSTLFQYGIYEKTPIAKYTTKGGPADNYAPSEIAIEDTENFKVRNIEHPSMPKYNIAFNFIKDILTSNDAYAVKLNTTTAFVSTEVETKNKKEDLPVNTNTYDGKVIENGDIPFSKNSEIVIPKESADGSTNNMWDVYEQADSKDLKSDLYGIYKRYFKFKPFNSVFASFIGHFDTLIYNTLFELETSMTGKPALYADRISAAFTDLKAQVTEASKAIDTAIEEAKASGNSWDRTLFLRAKSAHKTYFNYIIAKEFDNLLKLRFPSIDVNADGTYGFTKEGFKLNQMKERESISLIDASTKMVKLHIFNMPLLEKQQDGTFKRTGTANATTLSTLIREFQDNNITTIDKAKAFLEFHPDPVMQSFYHRFISKTPAVVTNKDNVTSKLHSFSSNEFIGNKGAKDTVTSILSFITSGKVSEYIKRDYSSGKLEAPFTFIQRNLFRNNLEAAVKSQLDNSRFELIGNDTVKITYNKRKGTKLVPLTMTIKVVKGEGTVIEGNQKDMNTVFNEVFHIAPPAYELLNEFLNIETPNGTKITNKIAFDIASYLAIEPGLRGSDIFEKGNLIDWIHFTDKFQNLKNVDSAFGYSNINGDRVELLTVGSPIIYTNQRIKTIISINNARDAVNGTPTAFANNAFVRGTSNRIAQTPFIDDDFNRMKIETFQLKEGFISDKFSKPNKNLSESEQMLYDFKYLFLESLTHTSADRGRGKNGLKETAVVFHPLVYSDKSSDYAVRIRGQFVPVTNGKLDIKALKDRVINSISSSAQLQSHTILKQYNELFGEEEAVKFGFAYNKDAHIQSKNNPLNAVNIAILKQKLEAVNRYVESINQLDDVIKAEYITKIKSSPLTNILGYDTRGGVITGINQNLVNDLLHDDIVKTIDAGHAKFLNQYKENLNISPELIVTEEEGIAISRVFGIDKALTEDEMLTLFSYNFMNVYNEFSNIVVGSIHQYTNIGDNVKRASQTTTGRQKFILRDESWNPNTGDLLEGRKLNTTSKVAIINDFKQDKTSINYSGEHSQEIYDGAAFHNRYARKMMKASYGNDSGFNVSSTLKPISNDMNFDTGVSKFDKYASFEITAEMLTKGAPFIRKIYELQMASVPFTKTIEYNGIAVTNALELERAVMQVKNWTYSENDDAIVEETLNAMVASGIQDDFIQETIFDSSVKSGVSNLNVIDSSNYNNIEGVTGIIYTERGNETRGLVLDASHNPDDARSVLPTQIVSAVMQGNFSTEQAANIHSAIAIIGEIERRNIYNPILNGKQVTTAEYYKSKFRDKINKRGDIGLITDIVNNADYSANSKTVLGQMFSTIANNISDFTIRFKVKGGQQVVAPATGVFDTFHTFNEATNSWEEQNGELRGFDAFKIVSTEEGNVKISIRESQEWLTLKDAYNSGNQEALQIAREALHDILQNEYTNIQQPQIIIAPTMFSDFGIPKGTELNAISAQAMIEWDVDKLAAKLMVSDNLDEIPAKLKAREIIYGNDVDAVVAKYNNKFIDFRTTLDIPFIRIPLTNKQSYMTAEVVGFANDADNTAYVNTDILYLQGADQDIDKGNILTYEAVNGKVYIPTDIEEAKKMADEIYNTFTKNGENLDKHEIALSKALIPFKNMIVDNVNESSINSDTLLESTTPTTTDNLESLAAANKAFMDRNVHRFNAFTPSTMFVRGQAGMGNVGIHAAGIRTYSAIYYAYNKGIDGKKMQFSIPAFQSTMLKEQVPEIKGISDMPNNIEYLDSMMAFSEFINASVDNAKNPILGSIYVDRTTGGIVNAMLTMGYNPQQIVDFLGHPSIQNVIKEYEKITGFDAENYQFATLKSVASDMPMTSEVLDLMALIDIADDFGIVALITGLSSEVPNANYDYYKFITKLNLKLKGVTTIENFIAKGKNERQADIDTYQELVDSAESSDYTINILQVIDANEHIDSYLKSTILAGDVMGEISTMYNRLNYAYKTFTNMTGKPMSDKTFKEINELIQGAAVDEFLKAKNETVTLTIDGNKRVYSLGTITGEGTTLGRIEFMRDFPTYFKGLTPMAQNTIQDHMIVERVGKPGEEINILKLESNFKAQSSEMQITIKSALENMEIGGNEKQVPDLFVPKGDSSTKQALLMYSLIKDRGGNSGTSVTALFDDTDFAEYNTFLDGWSNAEIDRGFNSSQVKDIFAKWSTSINYKTRDLLKKDVTKLPYSHYNFIPYSFVDYKVAGTTNEYKGARVPLDNTTISTDNTYKTTVEYLNAAKKKVDTLVLTKDPTTLKTKDGITFNEVLKAEYSLSNTEIKNGVTYYTYGKNGTTSTNTNTTITAATIINDVLLIPRNELFITNEDNEITGIIDIPSNVKQINLDVPTADIGIAEVTALSDNGFMVIINYDGTEVILRNTDAFTEMPLEDDDSFPFQKAGEYYAKIKQRDVYSRNVTNRMLNGIIGIINNNGGNVQLMSTAEIEAKYGRNLATLKGFVDKSAISIINKNLASLDTPIHETGHVWIKALKYSNKALYNSLIDQALEHESADRIIEKYPELAGTGMRESLGEEIFSMLFGLNGQQKAIDSYNATFLTRMRNTMSDFVKWLNSWFADNLGIGLKFDDTLQNVLDTAAGTLFTSSYFGFKNNDLMIMQNLGIDIPTDIIEIQEIKRKLAQQGLLIKTC